VFIARSLLDWSLWLVGALWVSMLPSLLCAACTQLSHCNLRLVVLRAQCSLPGLYFFFSLLTGNGPARREGGLFIVEIAAGWWCASESAV